MDPRIRYCVELDQIKNIPNPNRIRTETRFFLLKEFADQAAPRERQRLGGKYRVKAAMQAFCQEKGFSLTSFYRWQDKYHRFGIIGLVPHFGGQKGTTARKLRPDHIRATIDIDPFRPLLCLRQLVAAIKSSPAIPSKRASQAIAYLERELPLLKRQTRLRLFRPLADAERQTLAGYRAGTQKNQRAKAIALMMIESGCTMEEVTKAAGRAPGTIYRWLRLFQSQGLTFIETHIHDVGRERMWHDRAVRVVGILHEAPRLHGINREAWTLDTIRQAYLQKYKEELPAYALKKVLKSAGYTWRHARKVMTSPDPYYREKLGRIIDVLHTLEPDEAFFFIDEAGPWRVKKYGGRALAPKGKTRIIPGRQKSKGAIYLVAALEAQSNQISWQFTQGKSALSIIPLLKSIQHGYGNCRRICLTWDAISSHSASAVNAWIAGTNASRQADGLPLIEVYPLPSKAQFLNLIEATFSALRRAVIHNSDYACKEEMQAAIARYFEERNTYFLEHPKRAGNKIWDRERLKIEELPGGLFRRM